MFSKRIFAFAYLFENNKGSEYAIGWELLSFPYSKNFTIVVPSFSFENIPCRARKFRGITFKSFYGKIIIKIDFMKIKPLSASMMRLHYTLWLIYCFFRINDRKYGYWFVNLVQAATLNPYYLFMRQNVLAGPVGGQAKLYSKQLFSKSFRIRNFLLTEIVYKFATIRCVPKDRILFIDSSLAEQFYKDVKILPAITAPETKEIVQNPFVDRKRIVCYTRNVGVKLPEASSLLLQNLADEYPQFEFVLIGMGPKVINRNLYHYQHLPQHEFHEILRTARLLIVTTQELAGFVQFEAAVNACPNIYLNLIPGRKPLLTENQSFIVNLRNPSMDEFLKVTMEKISNIILNDELLENECKMQFIATQEYTLGKKFSKLTNMLREL